MIDASVTAETAPVRRITIEKRDYSRSPWRLVDSATGREVEFRSVEFDHGFLGKTSISASGFDTKAEALHELGRLAALYVSALNPHRSGNDSRGIQP